MMKRAKWGSAAAALVSLCLLGSGCGLTVQLTTSTGPVVPGSSVPFTLGITNPSQCPVGQPIGIFLPFIPATEFSPTGNSAIDQIFQAIVETACTGQPVTFPSGISCTIVEETLVCELGPALTTGEVPSVEVPVRAGDKTVATCTQQGSKITCTMTPLLADANVVFADPLTCIPIGGLDLLCGVDELAPGASATTSFSLFAPIAPGTYRSLWIAFAQQTGVCQLGTDAGDPCDEDSDCAMPGTCAPGICVNSMTQATAGGCSLNTDCAMTETCVTCQPDPGPGVNIPLACAQITIGQTAPAQSPWGMVGSAVALLALGFLGLRRMRRA